MRDFLDLIQPGAGLTEVRRIMDGKVVQHWFDTHNEVSDLSLQWSDQGWDVYYGVLPRTEHGGTKESVVRETATLWADVDAKAHGGSKQAGLMALIDFDVPPAVVVDSGHGYHAYWVLDHFISVDRAETIMRGIARQVKGDHVYDAPRILRLPGTQNWKDPEHPLPVRVLRFDATRRYRPGDFGDAEAIGFGEHERENRKSTPTVYIPPADRKELPDWLDELITQGAPQGQRSEAC
jgi:putative DNA primase/helicase